jgi:hypothetical protein
MHHANTVSHSEYHWQATPTIWVFLHQLWTYLDLSGQADRWFDYRREN